MIGEARRLKVDCAMLLLLLSCSDDPVLPTPNAQPPGPQPEAPNGPPREPVPPVTPPAAVLAMNTVDGTCVVERILLTTKEHTALGTVPVPCQSPGYSLSGDGTKLLLQMGAGGPIFLLKEGKAEALPALKAEVVALLEDGSIQAVVLGELTGDGMRGLIPHRLEKGSWVAGEVILKLPGRNQELLALDGLEGLPYEGFAREIWSLADTDWGDFGFHGKTNANPENGNYIGWRRQNTELAIVASEAGWSGPVLKPSGTGSESEWIALDAEPFMGMELRSAFLVLYGEKDRLYAVESYAELFQAQELRFWPTALPLPGGTPSPGAHRKQREEDYTLSEATGSRTRGGRPGDAPPPNPLPPPGIPPEGQPGPPAGEAGPPAGNLAGNPPGPTAEDKIVPGVPR